MDFKQRTSVYCVEEFLNPGNKFDEGSLRHVTNASTIKGNPLRISSFQELIKIGSEGEHQMGYYTHLFMSPEDGPHTILS